MSLPAVQPMSTYLGLRWPGPNLRWRFIGRGSWLSIGSTVSHLKPSPEPDSEAGTATSFVLDGLEGGSDKSETVFSPEPASEPDSKADTKISSALFSVGFGRSSSGFSVAFGRLSSGFSLCFGRSSSGCSLCFDRSSSGFSLGFGRSPSGLPLIKAAVHRRQLASKTVSKSDRRNILTLEAHQDQYRYKDRLAAHSGNDYHERGERPRENLVEEGDIEDAALASTEMSNDGHAQS